MNLYCKCNNHKWGFVDEAENPVIPFIYDYVYCFENGLAYVRKGGYCGYIDETGKEVIPCIYDSIFNYVFSWGRYGLFTVYKDGQHGYIDRTGKEIVPLDYYPENFEECHSVNAVQKYSDMQATLSTYKANIQIEKAQTEDEAKEIVETYRDEICRIIDNRIARIKELSPKKDLTDIISELAKDKIQAVTNLYIESREMGE